MRLWHALSLAVVLAAGAIVGTAVAQTFARAGHVESGGGGGGGLTEAAADLLYCQLTGGAGCVLNDVRAKRATIDLNAAPSNDYVPGDETIVGATALPAGVSSVSLPTAQTIAGRIYIIKDETGTAAGGQDIRVGGQAGQLVDGNAFIAINTDHGSLSVYSDGTNWFTF